MNEFMFCRFRAKETGAPCLALYKSGDRRATAVMWANCGKKIQILDRQLHGRDEAKTRGCTIGESVGGKPHDLNDALSSAADYIHEHFGVPKDWAHRNMPYWRGYLFGE